MRDMTQQNRRRMRLGTLTQSLDVTHWFAIRSTIEREGHIECALLEGPAAVVQ